MGLYVQRDALQIAQKALDVTGNNISNIETVGYTRQRVDICSVGNWRGTLGYNTGISLAGMGSEAIGVAQVRNRLLDKKVRDYNADLCNVGVKMDVLGDIEDIFDSIEADAGVDGETNIEASFASIVNSLKAALQGFSSDHADRTEMANIALHAAESLVNCITNCNSKITDVSKQTLGDAKATVEHINTILEKMGTLNKEIKLAYIAMDCVVSDVSNYKVMNDYGPLELKDDMNNLLDELSQYGNIDYTEEADGTFTVMFAGQVVVEGKKYAQMAITETDPEPTELQYVITKAERNSEGKIIAGLYDKETWYNMHVAKATGEDSQVLIREYAEELGIDLKNITGGEEGTISPLLLDSGSLRGFLDVYNGRGIYADTEYKDAVDLATIANTALANLKNDPTADAAAELEGIGAVLNAGTVTAKDTEGNTVILFSADVSSKISANTDGTVTAEITNADGTTATVTLDVAGTEIGNKLDAMTTPYSNSEKGIEYYRDMLNAFVKTMTEEFNNVYSSVENVMIKNPDYVPGDPDNPEYILDNEPLSFEIFTYEDDDGNSTFRTAAENFRIAGDWLKNPELIANPTNNNEYEELDNVYIHKLLGIFANQDLKYGDDKGHFDSSKFAPEEFVSHVCEDLGKEVETNMGIYQTTNVALISNETARSERMHVSMNEEGINMMNYQKWYNAISRMISTMDEALDKLINNTGIVGLR